MKIGFDNQKYLSMQSEHIMDRLAQFGGKLYLEFGGKLFDDFHASRVLPGFEPDSKVRMLLQLKDQAEIVIAINAADIEKNKVRGDLGITYDLDVLRLIDAFRSIGLYVGSVVLTQYRGQSAAGVFQRRLEQLGIKVYRHYPIPGYPNDIETIVSDEGYGLNEYIETTRSLVVVTAPGPGSGKMATCLSQLYHENKRGVRAGYAKFETFPLENYGVTTVNYNRDVEIFPVLNAMFRQIYGESPYKSPTDMGVNMAGNCITDDEVCCEASRQEIIRRYYAAMCSARQGMSDSRPAEKIKLLINQLGITVKDRPVIDAAVARAEQTGEPAAAIQLPDGEIVTGKTTKLLGASAAVLLNALKRLGGIQKDMHLISPIVIEPIQDLKVNHLGNHNPRLHMDEVLIALSISAATNPTAEVAMRQLDKLRGCEAHSTVILSGVDSSTFRKLGINVTCEPKYQTKKLYHK